MVVESEFCSFGDVKEGKECQFIDVPVIVIVRDCEKAAIGRARVVNEATWGADVLSVAYIRPRRVVSIGSLKLIKIEQEVGLVNWPCSPTMISLIGRDDLPPIRINELTLLYMIHASKTPCSVTGLEYLKTYLPSMLDNSILAEQGAITPGIAFVDVVSALQDFRP